MWAGAEGVGGAAEAELPEELQAEVRALQVRMSEDLNPVQHRDAMDLQILMQSRKHSLRLRLLRAMVAAPPRHQSIVWWRHHTM